MVRTTEIVCGLLLAPEAVTVTVPLYACALRPAVLMPRVSVPEPVPEAADTVSQDASDEAAHGMPSSSSANGTGCGAAEVRPLARIRNTRASVPKVFLAQLRASDG
jgi:hypothetical protein